MQSKNQRCAFIWISIVMLIATGGLTVTDQSPYQKFFGQIHPLLPMAAAVVGGYFLLHMLSLKGHLKIYSHTLKTGVVWALLIAICFFVPIIIVDLVAPFPEDTNVLLPASILFYPTIGFFVEITFHLIPMLFFMILFRWDRSDQTMWKTILIISLVEPTFQTILAEGNAPGWKVIYVFLHIYGINLASLYLFRRFDFLSMYALRLWYYLLWHVIWGMIRMDVLF